jgi:RNA polymerase-binding transcription factor DksA
MRSENAAAKKAADKATGSAAAEPIDPESTRYRSMYSTNIEASQAAAAKFAASAGLDPSMVAMAEQAQVVDQGPRLTKSPFGKRDLARYRDMLVAKREELLSDMVALEEEALTGGGSGSLSTLPQHMADQGSDNWEQTMALGLVASQRAHVKEVDAAIGRIDNGTFGICEETGQAINRERLDEAPWARLSIEAARERERLGYRR